VLRSAAGRDGERGPEPDPGAARPDEGRDRLARDLAAYQREIDAPEAAVRAAEALADPDVRVVVTGQQPGLLGGPLLTLAKALSAIAWADRLAADGRPAVPVFWAATEDHDLDEVNRVELLDVEDRPLRLGLELEGGGRMLSAIDPGAEADRLLGDLEKHLPGGGNRELLLETVRETRAPSLGTWFARLLARWLGGFGLVLVEPRLLRSAAARVLEHEHARPGEIASRVREGPLEPAATPFFRIEDGRRVRPGSVEDLPRDPEAVSWDVVTRVLAQDLIFPVAGQVVGPSERAYCAQIAPAHALFDVPAPPLLPRASLTLVERKVEKALARFGRTVTEVLRDGEAALEGSELEPEEFDEALTRLTEALDGAFTEVRDEAGRVDETLLRKAEGSEKEILRAIDRLRDHARKAMDRVTGQDAERRRKVLAHLVPGGKPQDRVLSPLPFLSRHGPKLVGKLLEVVREHPDGDRIVYLSGKE